MRCILFAVVTLALGGAADAQPGRELRFSSGEISDDIAREALNIVTANITNARDERGQNLRALSAAESSKPLLALSLVKEVMDIARASAAGEGCKLDWAQRNYLKLMHRERERGDRSTHEIAAISMIHGYTSSQFDTNIPCPPEQRARIEAFYASKWPETH